MQWPVGVCLYIFTDVSQHAMGRGVWWQGCVVPLGCGGRGFGGRVVYGPRPEADTPLDLSQIPPGPKADTPHEMATAADGTHPTGMHSCCKK